jgi:hypothetical protein
MACPCRSAPQAEGPVHKVFFLRRGYREGLPGLFVAFMEAFYVYLKYFKLWELGRKG